MKVLKIVYSPHYDIQFFGIEKLHPFDSCKYSKAWKKLKKEFGREIDSYLILPEHPASDEEISKVHTHRYLGKLQHSRYIAEALEILPLALLPSFILDEYVLKPMRWATKGTIIAAEEALKGGIAVNLSGGYHHADREKGEGFCIYSDIGIAIETLRYHQYLDEHEKVLIVDLDAHQGQGLERIFYDDKSIYFFDMYNKDIYPNDQWAQKRINCNVPLHTGSEDREYLEILKKKLTSFLRGLRDIKLAFYNAGTDIYKGDPLGGLNISSMGVLERDKFVFEKLTASEIPWVMVPSGGYTQESYQLIANSLSYLIRKWGIGVDDLTG